MRACIYIYYGGNEGNDDGKNIFKSSLKHKMIVDKLKRCRRQDEIRVSPSSRNLPYRNRLQFAMC